MKRLLGLLLLVLIVSGCANSGRYHQKVDSKPKFDYGVIDLEDATPTYEPYREINSRPYTVLGQYYVPMLTGKGYHDEGYASWYGQKFHGHLTSNGEVYDMFEMTAAHKTLPLPSYARVTNLSNERTVIVRINDRGPFHPDRIIDLSYAAAKKLDFLHSGTAKVKLEVIHIDELGYTTIGSGPTLAPEIPSSIALNNAEAPDIDAMPVDETSTTEIAIAQATKITPIVIAEQENRYIQIAAVSTEESAKELKTTLSAMYQVNAKSPLIDDLYRVRLGPIQTEQKAEKLIQSLKQNGFDSVFQVFEVSD